MAKKVHKMAAKNGKVNSSDFKSQIRVFILMAQFKFCACTLNIVRPLFYKNSLVTLPSIFSVQLKATLRNGWEQHSVHPLERR